MDVNEELKFCENSKKIFFSFFLGGIGLGGGVGLGGGGQGGGESRIEVFWNIP